MSKLMRHSWLSIALVAGLQTLVLAYIVYDRIALLTQGREIVAEVIPVDPRDLFRGDYVVLGYNFTQSGDVAVPVGTRGGDVFYVTLAEEAPQKWAVKAVSATYPETTEPSQVVVKGRVTHVYPDAANTGSRASLRYGIESYFVPEGTGKDLEEKVREKKIHAVLAVDRSGQVAIKALMVDGTRLAEEPLL